MEYKMSDAERYVMGCFWSKGSMKSDEVASMVVEKGWKQTTLLTFLSRLAAKGMLRVDKKGKSNLYTPIVSEEEYLKIESRQFLDEMYAGSAKSFLAAMIDSRGLTKEDIGELREWLNSQEVDDDA